MVTRIIFLVSFFACIFASGTVIQEQKFPCLDEVTKLEYPVLKALVEQHLDHRKEKGKPLILSNETTDLGHLSQSLSMIHANEFHLALATAMVENSFLAGKKPQEIFEIAKDKYPGILMWLLTVPLDKWPSSFDAHCFLAWILERPGFDLALWLERWFESNFRANIEAAYKADSAAFMEHILAIPCERKLPDIFQSSRSFIVKYDAVNILKASYHLKPDYYRYTTGELVEAGAIKITRHLKAIGVLKSFRKEPADTIIMQNLAGPLEVALELGYKLTVNDVFLAVQHNGYDCIRVMDRKKHRTVIEGLFQAVIHNRTPISVEFIKTTDIKFSQDDLNLLGGYLPPETINYIYLTQHIVPRNPMMKRPSAEAMEIEKQQANKSDHGSLVDSFKRLDLNDPPVTDHHRACPFIDKVIGSITDNEKSVSEKLMNGKLLDYYLGVAKNYGIKVSAAYRLLSDKVLPGKDLSKYLSEALMGDLVGISWVLQAAPLEHCADERMVHQFLIRVFEHPYSYDEASWFERFKEADFTEYTRELYLSGNRKLLEEIEGLSRDLSKGKRFTHSKELFLSMLNTIIYKDAAETVEFFIKKCPDMVKELKDIEDLVVKVRAIKTYSLLQGRGIVQKFKPARIESIIKENDMATLRFALDLDYALRGVDIKLAIQQNALECIRVMKDKDLGMVKKLAKEVLLSDPQLFPFEFFEILEIELTQADVNKLPLNVPTKLVESIFKKWGMLPRISQMKKTGTIELGLVKYLKTLPLNKNLDEKQIFNYFENIRNGKYDEVTELRLLEYYLFVAIKQFEKSEIYVYSLVNKAQTTKNPSNIYTLVLKDKLAHVAKYLQTMPKSQWFDTEEAYFFSAKILGNADFRIEPESENEIKDQVSQLINEALKETSAGPLRAVFAANNTFISKIFSTMKKSSDSVMDFFQTGYGVRSIAANDAVESIIRVIALAKRLEEYQIKECIKWDAINIIRHLEEQSLFPKISEEMVLCAIINDSSRVLAHLLNGRKLGWLEVTLAIHQKSFSCIRVMMKHDLEFVRKITGNRNEAHPTMAPKTPKVINPPLKDKGEIMLHKEKKMSLLADIRDDRRIDVIAARQDNCRAEIVYRDYQKKGPNLKLTLKSPIKQSTISQKK